jgi:hypothetical protein
MSCNSENTCCVRGSFFKLVLLLLVGAIVVASRKEIIRYIKISSM